MNILELTLVDKKDLEKRGFLVKEYLTFFDFCTYSIISVFKSILTLIIGMYLFSFLGGISQNLFDYFQDHTWQYWLILFIPLLFLVKYFKTYAFQGKIFYGKKSFIAIGKKFDTSKDFIEDPNYISKTFYLPIEYRLVRIIFYWWILGGGLFTFMTYFILQENSIFLYLFLLSVVIISFLFRQLIEEFHPLYAFGNLGEKIQNLTPQIVEKSEEIQANFQKDMNFGILSEGFDSLSSTFSQIISFVIKLEKIEQKANKGNLFDSEKYINSLRSDIIEPLQSLKTFLEKQKEKLMEGQKDLQKVRVKVGESKDSATSTEGQKSNELISETSLSSKRSELLLNKLEENIEKLNAMIGKLG